MFQKNDIVLYSPHGVCRIENLTDLCFRGVTRNYYILRPLRNSSAVIFVPSDSESLLTRMHAILTREGLEDLMRSFCEIVDTLSYHDLPHAQYKAILIGDDRLAQLKLIHILHTHQVMLRKRGRKLYSVDERALREAEKILFDEFSYVLELHRESIPSWIQEQIKNRTSSILS